MIMSSSGSEKTSSGSAIMGGFEQRPTMYIEQSTVLNFLVSFQVDRMIWRRKKKKRQN